VATNGYVTVGEMEGWVDGLTAQAHGAIVDEIIGAVSRSIDSHCQRSFWLGDPDEARTLDVTALDGVVTFGPFNDLASITELATDDLATGVYAPWLVADYQLVREHVMGVPGPYTGLRAIGTRGFPYPYGGVRTGLLRITGQWGWPEVPEAVRLATRIWTTRLFKRRDSPEGVVGFADLGVVRMSRKLDPDVEQLLEPYKLAGAGTGAIMVAEYL
jgi:hypothetical protein